MPVLGLMAEPDKIQFEDDICQLIKQMIRKQRTVSPALLQVLPFLEKTFIKNKHCFGSVLLDCLNYYLIYGKDTIGMQPDLLKMFFRMADQALFTETQKRVVNNSEGALLIQIILQIFAGNAALNEILGQVLDRVTERLSNNGEPLTNKLLKKHLLNVFVASLYYNPVATLCYLKTKGILKDVLLEIFKLKADFRESYE